MSTAIAKKFAMEVPDVATTQVSGTLQWAAMSSCNGGYPYRLGPLISISSICTPSSDKEHGITPLAARLKRAGLRFLTHSRYSDLMLRGRRNHKRHKTHRENSAPLVPFVVSSRVVSTAYSLEVKSDSGLEAARRGLGD